MARPKAPCGEYAAYRRHLREKTEVCAPCREAKRENSRARSGSAAARVKKQVASEAAKVAKAASPPLDVSTSPEESGEPTRLETLAEMLKNSQTVITVLMTTDPARAYLQMREQREILREISEIQQQGEAKKEVSLGDQLAAARAARLEREAVRQAGT